jgi:hypothetical protein
MNTVIQQDLETPTVPVAPSGVPASPMPPPLPPSSPIHRWVEWGSSLVLWLRTWFADEGCWYVSSLFAHAFVLFSLALITLSIPRSSLSLVDQSPTFEPASLPPVTTDSEIKRFEVGEAPLDPTELNAETLAQFEFKPVGGQTEKYFDESPQFEDSGGGTVPDREAPQLGGLGGLSVKDLPGPGGKGGVGIGAGTGTGAGFGGDLSGFGGRGKGHREAILGPAGGTKASERAVGAALNWISRHQTPQGKWSIDYRHQCKGNPCSGAGEFKADSAATALALLPFLAAGQTHKSKGLYQKCIGSGLTWLMKQQDAEGDLSGKCLQPMYAHGMATLALCEAFGMTKDPAVGAVAQKAIGYIERAQNDATGGWRYEPKETGDTSVFGWQMMALKSAQLAGLTVDSNVIENSRKWLRSVAKGEHLGLYSYQPYREVTPSMTAVGMLCSQYLGAGRNDPPLLEGMQYILGNLPDNTLLRDNYYWYYATLAMHNMGGAEWDAWNWKMRRVLIESQVKGDGCDAGSWDPNKPTLDVWASQGGRLMLTTFNAMTLEVYYRYMPLFNTDTLVPTLLPATTGASAATGEKKAEPATAVSTE